MKFFNTLLISSMLAFAPLSFATDDPYAPIVSAFNDSQEIQDMITVLKENDPNLVQTKIDVVPVSGGCGFAGCDNRYVVILRFENNQTNAYYTTVSAIVTQPAVGETKVEKRIHF